MKVPPASAELPVLVTVRVFAALLLPVGQTPKASVVGVTVAVCVAARPVPVRATGEPVTATLPVIVTVPVEATAEVGENTTLMVQVELAGKAGLQVPPAAPVGLENGAVTTTVMPVAVAPPALDRVRVCAVLVLPVTMLPKARLVGETLRTAKVGA